MNNKQLQQLIFAQQRGYRSNKYLEAVRPNPHMKQRWCLSMDHLEVFFGGAAGGGKSDLLLMDAIKYIDIPGYAAIIFRRTYEDLSLPGALMDRAGQWFTGLLQKRDGGKRWESPEGGVLQFAYLQDSNDKFRYQSAEFQFCAFDELSHFPEDDYKYLFSRLRRPSDPDNPLSQVPLRMRSASNPGGVHGEWVKTAFVPQKYLDATEDEQFSKVWAKRGKCLLCNGVGFIEIKNQHVDCPVCEKSGKATRYFIPARLQDNPSVDELAYLRSLANLPPLERAQLEHGRWDLVSEGNLFQRSWIRKWRFRGAQSKTSKAHIELDTQFGKKLVDSTMWWPLITADTASKTKTTNDPTVICAWAVCLPRYELCLLEVIRERMLIPHILPAIKNLYEKWDASMLIIEEASSGIAIVQDIYVNNHNIATVPFNPMKAGRADSDKVSRSTDAQNRMQTGMIFFPDSKDQTIVNCLNEMLLFPESAHDDFVDNLSMAGWFASGKYRSREQSRGQPPAEQIRTGVTHARISRY